MIKIDENDPIGEVDPSFPFRDVVIRRNTDMKEFYDLQKEIGRGKFGTVYRCTEKSTGLKLAAKFIGISKRQDRRNAEREVEIMRELQHPRLIQMYDAFEINNIMCVVLELIEGGELFERVIDDDFILTEKSVSIFMRQICEGISFIHSKNILHLDMKPENILCLTRTGNRIKIIDFGLARKYDPEKKLQVLFGTPEFVAPEVVNFDSIGFGTDLWSVGVICYVLISGLSPFMGETDVQTMANVTIAQYDFDDEAFNDISADAKDFIGKLLLKDREQRMSATECLSHRWLQRRTPPVSSIPPSIPNSQSELDLQKDTLRYLVDRWNNDTNIALVVNNDDDKCDKVIDICKINGIAEQRSKSQDEFVYKPNSLAANDTTTTAQSAIERGSSVEIAEKLKNFKNTTLVPIQSIEAPLVSNQVLKSLPNVTSIDKPMLNLNKRSLSPDTAKIENSKKEPSTKISKSASSSRSGSTSPVISELLLNGEAENKGTEHSPDLLKPSLLVVPDKSHQKLSSDIKKSPSTSPNPSKKPLAKTPSPSIRDHQAGQKDELINNQEKITKEKSSPKLPKSPSSLEIPKQLPQMESAETTKSPSTSPKPRKKGYVKIPSPSIRDHQEDQKDELITNKEDITKEQSGQKLPKSPSSLEIPKKLSQMESAETMKSPSTSPKPTKKTSVKTRSASFKIQQPDHKEEHIPNEVEITNNKSSQEASKPSLLEAPRKSVSHAETSHIKKSPSTSPKPLKKKPAKSPSPSLQDQQSDNEDVDHKVLNSVTLEKSPQRDTSNGKKSPITVPQQTINFAKVSVSEFQEEVVDNPLPKSDAEICDIVKETPIVDMTAKPIKSEDGAPTSGNEFAQGKGNENTKSKDKLQDIPSANPTRQLQSPYTPIVEISDETYEYVKKRRFTIKSVESMKRGDKDDSTSHMKSIEKTTTTETSPQPHRRSIFSPEVSPKVLRKLNNFVSTSELMKRRISDISNLLTRKTEHDVEQSIPDGMPSFYSKLNRIARLRHDSYSIDGSSNFKRPKFRISYFSRDVPLASTPPLHADLLNYLPFGDETVAPPVWSFHKTNPFHSDPSSLRNSPERFASPSLTKKLLSKFFNDSLEYDISSTPSTSANGLPKDKITGIIS